MTVEIENENNVITGDVQTPAQRIHLFTTHQAVCDFATTFNIQNYNVRYGQTNTGKICISTNLPNTRELICAG